MCSSWARADAGIGPDGILISWKSQDRSIRVDKRGGEGAFCLFPALSSVVCLLVIYK